LVVTVGTARGVLHNKTENTVFNRFIIPLLDATALIKEDVKLEYITEYSILTIDKLFSAGGERIGNFYPPKD